MSLEFLGGWLGGVSGLLVGYPLDTLKVSRQLYPQRGALESLRMILSRSGVSGLYSGVLSPVSSYGFLVSLNFGVYGAVCRSLSSPERPLPLSSHALAGALSGSLLSLVSCPFEVVKVTMQAGSSSSSSSASAPHLRSTPACAAHLWRQHGLRGFYRGSSLPANALTFVPGSALYFAAFAGISGLLRRPDGSISLGSSVLAGGVTGVLYWALIFPADALKSRLIADLAKPTPRLSMSSAWRELRASRALYRGFAPALLRSFPVNATMLSVNELVLSTRS